MRDLKSVTARGSLRMSKPVTIPIGLPFAILWLTGKKGVRSVLLESPVARAMTRAIVQASSGMSWKEERPEAVVSNRVRGHQCIWRCSGVLERMAIIRAICNVQRLSSGLFVMSTQKSKPKMQNVAATTNKRSMKNNQNPATAHHTIMTTRRPDNIHS